MEIDAYDVDFSEDMNLIKRIERYLFYKIKKIFNAYESHKEN